MIEIGLKIYCSKAHALFGTVGVVDMKTAVLERRAASARYTCIIYHARAHVQCIICDMRVYRLVWFTPNIITVLSEIWSHIWFTLLESFHYILHASVFHSLCNYLRGILPPVLKAGTPVMVHS